MKIQSNNIIGELVAQDYRTASVFKNYGIDFCCNGKRTISDACTSENIDPELMVRNLEDVIKVDTGGSTDYNSWPIDLLADYVEKKHHRYVDAKIPEIQPYLDKVCRVHGQRHPELLEISKLFNESAEELSNHMVKEESIVFPYIRKMVASKQQKTTMEKPHFGTIENPIQMMMQEHDTEGERFRRIEALTDNYTPPSDACNTYHVTFALLKEFQDDLHLHIHLENNILFPKAIALEKK